MQATYASITVTVVVHTLPHVNVRKVKGTTLDLVIIHTIIVNHCHRIGSQYSKCLQAYRTALA